MLTTAKLMIESKWNINVTTQYHFNSLASARVKMSDLFCSLNASLGLFDVICKEINAYLTVICFKYGRMILY